jgi:hypothetical protein
LIYADPLHDTNDKNSPDLSEFSMEGSHGGCQGARPAGFDFPARFEILPE